MIRIFISLMLLSAFVCQQTWAQTSSGQLVNAASLFSGSYMRLTPPSYHKTNLMGGAIGNYTPEALFDQSAKLWCSADKKPFPHVFELEFTETFQIQKLEFDNTCETSYKGICSKEVKVEFAVSATEPVFQTAGVYALQENQINTFDLKASNVRIIRISILSNYGNPDFTELAEFKAWGFPILKDVHTIDVNGIWQSNWGNVTFNQNQSLLDGHYVFNKGVIRFGGVNRNQISFTWIEKVIGREGQTIMFLNEEGNRLTGVWCHDNDWTKFGFWILDRSKKAPLTAYVPASVEKKYVVNEQVVGEMSTQLQKNRKLVLYGINFQTNSSQILEESTQILLQVAQVLKENPAMQVRIEGHTDAVGTDDANKVLSQNRAEAVKEFLAVTYGISQSRLATEGKGESKPVADNGTEIGKSANRRVEIHLVQ